MLVKQTYDKFGYSPYDLKKMSGKRIIYSCSDCSKELETQMSSYSKSNKICKPCSLIRSHKNQDSGYNSDKYRKIRSEVATKSNKNRKVTSEKYTKYLPFIKDLRDGKISFTEIANTLNLDDSTVCKFFHNNFRLKSTINYSLQEKHVGEMLESMFNITYQKRYSQESRHKSDYYCNELGHIEYDGNGFFHLKKSDMVIDSKYSPIRLNAQALFGGVDYLKYRLLDEKSGYCSVKSPKEYQVKLIDNRKESTKMLENCHILGNCAGKSVYGLYYKDLLIGVAKFGSPTNRYESQSFTELRRFFVLDGTPKNTESYFLRKCEKELTGDLITYIHSHEIGSYLKALGWKQHEKKDKIYDIYIVDGKTVSKRKMWGWAKKIGLTDKFGSTQGKELLVEMLGAEKILEPSKIKFTKEL